MKDRNKYALLIEKDGHRVIVPMESGNHAIDAENELREKMSTEDRYRVLVQAIEIHEDGSTRSLETLFNVLNTRSQYEVPLPGPTEVTLSNGHIVRLDPYGLVISIDGIPAISTIGNIAIVHPDIVEAFSYQPEDAIGVFPDGDEPLYERINASHRMGEDCIPIAVSNDGIREAQ